MSDDTAIRARILWAVKGGHRAEEYEDAAAADEDATLPLHAAVADGATESAFAGVWANHLVRGFREAGPVTAGPFREHLARWQAACQQAIEERATRGEAWYAEAKAEEGAFATFLGMVIRPDRSWQALAVGDCCLFHLRAGQREDQWPVDAPEDFTNRPALLSSQPGREAPEPQVREGTWQNGDAFLLATDALAAWLMEGTPAHLLQLDPTSFQERVVEAREAGALRNDDVTALVLETAAPTSESER